MPIKISVEYKNTWNKALVEESRHYGGGDGDETLYACNMNIYKSWDLNKNGENMVQSSFKMFLWFEIVGHVCSQQSPTQDSWKNGHHYSRKTIDFKSKPMGDLRVDQPEM